MSTSQTTAFPKHLVAWLAAGFAAHGLLPWALARAARAAGRRDFTECHEAAAPSIHR